MMEAEAKLKIVSREAGLTNAWNGTGWGMSYPADATLSTVLAIDYDGLIIPAGKRHIDTLENEAHAKRVLRAFLREDMPVMLQGEATAMLRLIDGVEITLKLRLIMSVGGQLSMAFGYYRCARAMT